MNVLLLHVKKSRLPEGFVAAPEFDHVSVITEPGHAQRYGPEVDVRLVDSIHDVDRVREATMGILRERDLHRVLSPFERGVPVAAYLRSYFGLPGLGYETATLFANKYLMKRRLMAAGIPTTRCRIAYALRDVPAKAVELGWPVVIKPVLGAGSIDVFAFEDPEAFAEFAASPAAESISGVEVPIIVEEFIDLKAEYHCDGVVHGGEVKFAAASKYLIPMLGCPEHLNCSHFLPSDHADRAEILELHARTVAAFGLDVGVTHMELLKTPRGLLVGEIACRPSGSGTPDAIRIQFGVDVWRAFVETSLGVEPELRVVERDGLIAQYQLPVRRGRIVRLSSASELADVPSVVRVDMRCRVGDVVDERVGSSSTTGLVFLQVRDQDEVPGRVAELAERYIVEVDGGEQFLAGATT